MNTPGSLDSLMVNILGSLNSPVINTPGNELLGVFLTHQNRFTKKLSGEKKG
jgi:hypothetical protein